MNEKKPQTLAEIRLPGDPESDISIDGMAISTGHTLQPLPTDPSDKELTFSDDVSTIAE